MADGRKLFVGGLGGEISESDISEYFSKYGEIEAVDLKKDNVTQRSRGFGFVTFKEAQALETSLEEKFHTIKGKKIEPRKAKTQTSKVFVGGLKEELTDEDIKNHFSEFGTITEAEMPFDKQQGRRKGFCFLIFEGAETAKNIIAKGKQTIKGIEVDVKKAVPLEGGGRGGGRGGRGGFRGGRGAQGDQGYWNQGYGGGYDPYGGYGGGYDYSGYGYDNYGGYGGGYDYSAGYAQNGYNGYGNYGQQQSYGGKAPNARGRGAPRGRPY